MKTVYPPQTKFAGGINIKHVVDMFSTKILVIRQLESAQLFEC